ncbi:unnamed protein product, partial [marine sediment metagenome]
MARRKAYPLYFRPYGVTIKELGRCPVKVALTSKETVGFFPLKAVHCKRMRTERTLIHPVYEDCKFHWDDVPVKEIPKRMLNTEGRDSWTDKPMKWMSG